MQALRRAQLQYLQRSEELRVRSQVSPEDLALQASPGPNKQQERRRRSREEAQAKVGTPPRAPLHAFPAHLRMSGGEGSTELQPAPGRQKGVLSL